MPELPEVETVVRGLRTPLIGRTFTETWCERGTVIHQLNPDEFSARIAGQQVQAITRRAKYVVCQLDHDYFLIHLRMTGRLYVVDGEHKERADQWLRLKIGLDNGQELRFSDLRRFGRVYLSAKPEEDIFPHIGPEPLSADFTAEVLQARLERRSKAIKPLLLDQAFVAGIGNIYADEALFRAQIHPTRRASTLTSAEISRLHGAILVVLRAGIEYEGASINWYRKPDGSEGKSQHHFYVYDREGQPCLVCGTPIIKTRLAQRGTHFCPSCQSKG